jgi:hypothetical protein
METKIFTEKQKSIFSTLHKIEVIKHFYIGNGAGLAIQIGHRKINEINFYTTENKYSNYLKNALLKFKSTKVIYEDSKNISFFFENNLVHFSEHPYPLLSPVQDTEWNFGCLDIKDIACMCLFNIVSRGFITDFIDLYIIIIKKYSLDQIISYFDEKYQSISYENQLILKSLVYFDEAEIQPRPEMLVDMNWGKIKNYFTKYVKVMTKL